MSPHLLCGAITLIVSWLYMILSIPFYMTRKSPFTKIFPTKLRFLPIVVSMPFILNTVSFSCLYIYAYKRGCLAILSGGAGKPAELDFIFIAASKSAFSGIEGMSLLPTTFEGELILLLQNITNLVYSLTVFSFLINLFVSIQFNPSISAKLPKRIYRETPAHVELFIVNKSKIPVRTKIYIILSGPEKFKILDYYPKELFGRIPEPNHLGSECIESVVYTRDFVELRPSRLIEGEGYSMKVSMWLDPLENPSMDITVIIYQEGSLRQESRYKLMFPRRGGVHNG